MGWQDRDWAKWDDRERANFLGAAPAPARRPSTVATAERRVELTLLAVLVSAAASFLVSHFHLYSRLASPQPQPLVVPASRVLYGTGLRHLGNTTEQVACTQASRQPDGSLFCGIWSVLMPGQHFEAAAPPAEGADCAAAEVDQHAGRWVCTAP